MKKIIYLVLGMMMFVLGAIGVVLPLLPTTPFLLGASFCFVRGSKRINKWFLHTKIYEQHLKSFVEERKMTAKQKFLIPLWASVMILIPFILVDQPLMRISLLLIICIKWYYFIVKIETRA